MSLTGQDPALLRRLNAAAVLRALYGADELTLTHLVRATSISRSTIEDVVAGLIDEGLVEEALPAADAPRSVGRPARRFRFRATAGHVVGVDIGPHKVLAITADLTGNIVDSRRTTVTPETPRDERLAAARTVIKRSLRSAGLGASDLRAIGVAASGVVDKGRVVMSSRLPDMTGADLSLAGLGDTPVVAGNDTKLATLAEHWQGVARDSADVVYVHAGRSISVGLLLGGRLHAGRHGAAGEIGVMHSVGWYEAFDRFQQYGGAEAVLTDARVGSDQALATIDAFATDLARGVGAVALTLDPDLVVLGGGLSAWGSVLIEPLQRELSGLLLFPVRVEPSTLGADSVALGAVRLALNHVEDELFGVS
ncbi:ROK family transcriptional regulator [Actinoallomurus sp. NPDC050550]|uniref:ROK family transcriptional regulator n=1 Tax=Actinoallomurus sp. NPDC050550 TaxID=3154937 RepID=UPI003400491B